MVPIFGVGTFSWLAGLLPTPDVRPPVAFLLFGLVFGVLVVTAAAIASLLSVGSSTEKRAHRVRLIAIAATTILGAVLAIKLYTILQAPSRPYPWLQDPTGYWAMLWVIVPGIWAGIGPGCIIYLAAIKSIPDELYEAADLDGAGPLSKAYHVTFQSLLPLIVINFVGAVVGTFHAMESVLVLTGGGPGNATMTLGMDIFFNAFTHLKFGYATSEAWVMGSLLIGFTVYQLRSLKRMKFKRAQ
jgi:ABC-type sugar transport system permease subunit